MAKLERLRQADSQVLVAKSEWLIANMAEVRHNLFYEREEWKARLMICVAFHCALVLGGFGLAFVMHPRGNTNWGTNSGEAVEAQLVSAAIPIPRPQEPTPTIVANGSRGGP